MIRRGRWWQHDMWEGRRAAGGGVDRFPEGLARGRCFAWGGPEPVAVAASGAAARPGRRGRRERCLCTRPLGQARVPPTAAAVAAFGVGHWQRRRAPAPSVVSATAPAAVPVIGAARVAGAARGPRHSRHGWPLVGRGEEEWCRCRRRHCPPQPLRAVPASPPRRKCPQVPLGAVQRSARGVTCAAAGRDGGCGGSGGHGGRSVGGGGGGHPLPRWSARAVGATLASRWWGLFPSAGRRGAAPGLVCQSRHHFEAWRGGRPLTGAAAFPALLADPSRGGGRRCKRGVTAVPAVVDCPSAVLRRHPQRGRLWGRAGCGSGNG